MSSRLSFIESKFKEGCLSAVRANGDLVRHFGGSSERAWSAIVAMDPSPRMRYLQWMCRLVSAGGLRAEDFYKVPEALGELQRCAALLRAAGVSSDINQYASLPGLSRALRPFRDVNTVGQTHRDERALVDEETIVHHRCASLLVVEPTTERASCYWGRGTQWCTASTDGNNAFAHYRAQNSRLFIYIHDGGTKYQGSTRGDFADECDRAMQWSEIPRTHLSAMLSSPLLLELFVVQCRRALEMLLPERLTGHLCLLAVQSNGDQLEFVPDRLRTKAICEAACRSSGEAIEHVPDALITEKLYAIAVRSAPRFLRKARDQFLTADICAEAVFQWPDEIDKVPERFLTPELCRLALCAYWESLARIPAKMATAELYNFALSVDGRALEHVPAAAITEEMARMAVGQAGEAIRFVPADLMSEDLAHLAVRQDAWALSAVPYWLRTPELYLAAVRTEALALELVPIEMRSRALCDLAVSANPAAIRQLPGAIATPSFLVDAATRDPRILGFALDAWRTPDVCLAAVSVSGAALVHVPTHLVSQEMVGRAVMTADWSLTSIPATFLTLGICRMAAPRAAEYEPWLSNRIPNELARQAIAAGIEIPLSQMPMDLVTREICEAFVSRDGRNIRGVPDAMIDDGLCTAAVRAGAPLSWVPRRLRTVEMCAAALTLEGESCLRDVPDELRNQEICELGCGRDAKTWYLTEIPVQHRTAAICEKAVAHRGSSLEDVPLHHRTSNLCTSAVTEWPQAMRHVPFGVRLQFPGLDGAFNKETVALARKMSVHRDFPF